MKRKLVVAFLVCFALWPLCQHVLVRTRGVDPWRLFAWGMYSAPGSMRTVRVVVLDAQAPPRVLSTRGYSPGQARIVETYRAHVQAVGALASADEAARELLELHPEWQGVALPVLTLKLDPETARTVVSVAQHTTWRDRGADYVAGLETFATP